METGIVNRDRLKPYVHKVEGPVNFAFYDMINGKFYHFSPEGSVEELRKILIEKGLIFQTDGVVPHKIVRYNLAELQHKINIRVLQIRLNGRGEDNCWNRKKNNCKKSFMADKTLDRLLEQCLHIPIEMIKIEAENHDPEKIEKILNGFRFGKLELNIDNGMDEKHVKQYLTLCQGRGIQFHQNVKKNIRGLKVELFNFFYSEYYNPCLGHQVAIDAGGDIKCCLWSEDILGNISDMTLKDMIRKGCFDKYWGISKDQIESCKECELRYACDDCRISALAQGGSIDSKPGYCDYNPFIGE